MVSYWSLSDSKSPQVSSTLLSILADLSPAVVWMVSTRPLTSTPSSPFTNSLVTVPRAPITMGITITFIFNSFFQFSSKVQVIIFSLSFNFTHCSAGTPKSSIRRVPLVLLCFFLGFFFFLFFLLIITRSGRVTEIR